jgi:CheY-like chemotaxis protein
MSENEGKGIDMCANKDACADDGGKAILFVDDEEVLLEIGDEMIRDLGYEPLLANSGQKALELFEENQDRIDLVVLDMLMPEMDGVETFTHLKRMNPCVKVLVASGYSKEHQSAKILRDGAKGFIQKPFSFEEFGKRVEKLIME